MKVATHMVFSESCLLCASAVLDFRYETTSVLVTDVCSVLPDADYPKSWLGNHLGGLSEYLNRRYYPLVRLTKPRRELARKLYGWAKDRSRDAKR